MDHDNFYTSSGNLARGVVGLVDAMLQRGAIRGEEITTIGQLRDAAAIIVQMAEQYDTEKASASASEPTEAPTEE